MFLSHLTELLKAFHEFVLKKNNSNFIYTVKEPFQTEKHHGINGIDLDNNRIS